MRLDEEALSEWQENPVTQHLQRVLTRLCALQKHSVLSAAWDRAQLDPDRVRECRVRQEVIEDLFQSSADDWNQMEEMIDEFERDTPRRL